MSDLSRLGKYGKPAAIYGAALVLSVLIAGLVLDLGHADLTVPFCYDSDGLWGCTWVKGMIENGWMLDNPSLGAPGELHMQDYPIPDNLHLAMLKLIGLATHHYAVTLNLYFLLTFPLTALSALYVLRRFTSLALPALAGSLLFTFLPYHLMRGEGHLFLAAYYLVPLSVLMVLWLYDGSLLLLRTEDNETRRRVSRPKLTASIVICLLVSAAGAYYAAFTCYFLMLAGLAAALSRKEWLPLAVSAGLACLIVLGGLANLAPTFYYRSQHGFNEEAAFRPEGSGEYYGLKPAQLLLPITGHRIRLLAQLKQRYNSTTPLVNENDTASLGLAGAAGFLLLLAWPFCRASRSGGVQHLDRLALLNGAALMLGTIGGLGGLLSVYVTSLRAFNRVSVFIGFFGLLAAVLVLEVLARRCRTRQARTLFMAGVGTLLILGILDQTSAKWKPGHARKKETVAADGEFVRAVEASLPERAMVFELPYLEFPEASVRPHKLGDYAHFHAYVHSRTLRRSYGAMKGREADAWQKQTAALPAADMVRELARAGFAGVWVDRAGYADDGTALEAELSRLLGGKPIVHSSKRYTFYRLPECRPEVDLIGSSRP